LMVENHPADSRVKIDETGATQTLTSRMGTGGGNVPMLMQPFTSSSFAQYTEGVGTIRAQGGDLGGGGSETLIVEPTFAFCPDPANTLLSKGNLSYRGDVDTVVAVDVRNLNETEELNGTLQSKASGGYSLNYQNPVRIGYHVRRLIPTECLRLQGFPDDWLDIEGASDSAKYKAVGNSVAMPCVDFIFSQIVKVLGKSDVHKPIPRSIFSNRRKRLRK